MNKHSYIFYPFLSHNMQVVPFNSETVWHLFVCRHTKDETATVMFLLDTASASHVQMEAILVDDPMIAVGLHGAMMYTENRSLFLDSPQLKKLSGHWCLYDQTRITKVLGVSTLTFDPRANCCIQ